MLCGCWELLAASVRKVNGCVSRSSPPRPPAPHRGPSTGPHPPGLARPVPPHYTTPPLYLHHIEPFYTTHSLHTNITPPVDTDQHLASHEPRKRNINLMLAKNLNTFFHIYMIHSLLPCIICCIS